MTASLELPRASSGGSERTARRTVDHVFILHTHDQERRVARLCDRLLDGRDDTFVLISHDRTARPLSPRLFERPSVAVVAGDGGRGDFTILEGYLAALSWLDVAGIDYKWVSNLSGQDYPVAPLRAFRQTCAVAGNVDGFIHHFPAFEAEPAAMAPWTWSRTEGTERYAYRYRRLKTSLSRRERALIRPLRRALDRLGAPWRINPSYGLMVGTRQKRTPFGDAFVCYAGSFWHTLNRRCAAALTMFVEEQPDVVSYFRSVLVPDESFVQTVLANTPGLRLVNDNLRYIDMRGSKHGRPKLLTQDDIPAIIQSGKFFARKFGDDAAACLDQIDRRLDMTASLQFEASDG